MEENQRISERLDQLEGRLTRLELLTEVLSKRSSVDSHQNSQASTYSEELKIKEAELKLKADLSSVEKKMATSVFSLGAASFFCFLLAAIYFVKIVYDSGWLTQQRQFGLGIFVSLIFIFLGLHLSHREKAYSSFLAAAGVVGLFIFSVAGYLFFHVIQPEVSVALLFLSGMISLFIYDSYRLRFFGVLTALGTYGGFFSLLDGQSFQWQVPLWIFLHVIFTSISYWKEARVVSLVSSYLSMLGAAILMRDWQGIGLVGVYSSLAVISVLGEVIITLKLKRQMKEANSHADLQNDLKLNQQANPYMGDKEALAYFPLLMVYFLLMIHNLEKMQPLSGAYFGIAYALSLNVLSWVFSKPIRRIAENKDQSSTVGWYLSPSQNLTLCVGGLSLLYSFYWGFFSEENRKLLLLLVPIFAGLQLLMAKRKSVEPLTSTYRIEELQLAPWARSVLLMAILAVGLSETIRLFGNLLWQSHTQTEDIAVAFVLSISLFLYILFLPTQKSKVHSTTGSSQYKANSNLSHQSKPEQALVTLSFFSHVMMMSTLYAWAKDWGSLPITLCWGAYALFLLAIAWGKKRFDLAKSSMVVFVIVGAKALIYDTAQSDVSARVLSLILTGGLLYVAGISIKKIEGFVAKDSL